MSNREAPRADELEALRAELRDAHATIEALRADRSGDARLRAVLRRSAEAFTLDDADGRIREAYGAVERITGQPAEEFVGRSPFDLVHPEDLERATALLTAVTNDPSRSASDELRLVRHDGAVRWLDVSITNRLGDPAVRAIVANFRDVTERHEAAEALRESEEQYRRVFEATPEPIIVHIDGRIAFANAAAARGLGLRDSSELIGRSMVELAHGASRQAIASRMTGAGTPSSEGMLPVVEQEFRRVDDGRIITAEVTTTRFVFDGRPAAVSVAHDVTERKTADDALRAASLEADLARRRLEAVLAEAFAAERERERLIATLEFERKRLGTLLQKAPAFLAVVRGPEHVFELANEAYHALVGGRDLLGRRVADALPEAAMQGFVAILDGVLQSGEPFIGTAMPLTLQRDGHAETRFLNFVYQPVLEADGTRSGVFALGVDVTEQVLDARRVRAQFEALPTPTLVFQQVARADGTPDFLFVDHNQAATRLTPRGIGPLGIHLSAYLPDDSPVFEDMRRALREGEVLQRQVDYRFRTSGERRSFLATFAPVSSDLVILFAEDVTHRVALEEQLRHSQKMDAIGRLAGGIAHDFNNLLSVILSYTAFLLDDVEPGTPMREDVEQIHKAGERAVELTRQLLTFSRQQLIAPQPVRLRECVNGIERMLRRVLGDDVELSLVTTDVGTVHGDPAQLDLVLMNLTVNARDAMPSGGTITIRSADVELDATTAEHLAVQAGPYVRLSVADTGTGMSATTKARAFEPFFTTKEVGKGTGLGLATVFGIVRQSRGAISVESELGAGSTFTIYLPRAEAGATPEVPDTERPTAIGSETILLVDDDGGVRTAARMALSRAGYHVIEAQTVGDALLLGEQHPETIHLLVTDVVMPRMSGPQLAERLVALRPSMRVLLVSGYAGDAMTRNGGAGRAFLQKPITPSSLVKKVRDVLDAPSTTPRG